MAVSTGGLIALTFVVTVAIIYLIILAVRLTKAPRNRPSPGRTSSTRPAS
ncbi:hypothetical protein ACFSTC_26180 [Nonomuraea ferruginea]